MSASNDATNSTVDQDYTLSQLHGTMMVLAWMIFASTGILFARYGRLLHIGKRVQVLGERLWFQIHRLTLCLAAIATLLGFFFILAQDQGQWVDMSDGRVFAHSILGVIIVCCAQLQVWMSLFRCHPDGRFRFIFNWAHRLTGLFAFTLSIPTIFLITFVLPDYHSGFIIILSLWSVWVVVIVIILEIIEYRCRNTSVLSTDNRRRYEVSGTNQLENFEMESTDDSNTQSYNKIKTILFSIHIIIAIGLAIPLIVLIWMQDSL